MSKIFAWVHLEKIGKKIKKKFKTGLRKAVSKKNKRNNNLLNHERCVDNEIETNDKLIPYSHETSASLYTKEELLKLNYICFVFLNIIYLHYETNKVDFCIQSIQNNPILDYAFRLSYNEFRAKFNTLQIISQDQGENLALELNRSARFFSTLTHFFELLPSPFPAVGGVIRLGISEINKRNKIFESKHALKYCKTNENFTQIVSFLFSCLLVHLKNLTDVEDLDRLVKKNFLIFEEILNEQAQQSLEKSHFPPNIEKIWAGCFILFALVLHCDPKKSLSTVFEPIQQPATPNLSNTHFFAKKLQLLPIEEMSSALTPRLIASY